MLVLFISQKIVNLGVLATKAFYISISKFKTLYKSIPYYIPRINYLQFS